ncbi:nuclear transport factor 2 family protein [Dyadobacter sp. NIV53]|uniref:nuclear transport factor 2 family protein n=1 Tax=Dyadobacter sp. NIV53 TaxID=2861765 RepID=UPI001C88567E|nr:nuclear transport factor 2 family protein [Dyadobacter sp. NIV53]
MTANEQLITKFYTSFQNKDYKGMQDCYADQAKFSDAAFVNLDGKQVRSMWEMLIKNGKDLKLTFGNISGDAAGGKAEWTAVYTFSRTGNKVTNNINARFEIENGKIVKHTDSFPFYIWAKQAFGFTGLLIGWTTFFKNKVRATAMENLAKFMQK